MSDAAASPPSLQAAWTGGQYSVVRFVAAATLAVAMAWQAATAAEFDASSPLLALACAGVAVGIGTGERVLAVLAGLALSFNAVTDITPAANQYAAAWLWMHACLPSSPYLSLSARGRTDPRGSWTMPWWFPVNSIALLVLARAVGAAHAVWDGNTMLAGLFVFTAVLVVTRATALAGWALSLGLGLGLAATGHGNLSSAWILHVVTFQPGWIVRRASGDAGTVFYDGSCAMCHGVVRFLLGEDTRAAFRIAPLGGDAFLAQVPEAMRRGLPDSVLLVRDGQVLMRGDAVAAILDSLGGLWVLVAAFIRGTPKFIVDAVYDGVAERRYGWFGKKTEACPLLPPDLRARFDA